jgi:hypothetical protein
MRKGQSHSEETKAKIAAAKLGKIFTPEHSAKISVALKGQKKTAAHKKAISVGIKAARANKVFVGVDEALPGSDVTIIDIKDAKGNSIEVVE